MLRWKKNPMIRLLLHGCAAVAFLFGLQAQAQKPFTNDEVIKLAQAGFGDEVIQKAIQAHAPAFDISPEGLSALKKAGVSEKMIAAILDRQSQAVTTTPQPPQSGSTPATQQPQTPPLAVGPVTLPPTSAASSNAAASDPWPPELSGMLREPGIYFKREKAF